MDLDFILSLAAPRGAPALVEIGATCGPSRERARLLIWSTGRIGARLGRDSVRFDRDLGRMGSRGGAEIRRSSLPALLAVFQHWVQHRDRWAAFYESASGYVPGYGGSAWFFQKPGESSKPTKLGATGMGGKRGKALTGRDVRKRLVRPIALDHGVRIVSRLRRVGESQTPAEGLPIGLVYELPGEFRLHAWRHEMRLVSARKSVWFERGEEFFLWSLLDASARSE